MDHGDCVGVLSDFHGLCPVVFVAALLWGERVQPERLALVSRFVSFELFRTLLSRASGA